MYLKPKQLKFLIDRINKLHKFSRFVGLEPYNIRNIADKTVKAVDNSFAGDLSYYHNYAKYFREFGMTTKSYNIFDGQYVWFVSE